MLKLVYTFSNVAADSATMKLNDLSVKVYRDTEWDEYSVRVFKNGVEQVMASYHTDDKQDAIDTARAMTNQGEQA
jgi:hypothetical protein